MTALIPFLLFFVVLFVILIYYITNFKNSLKKIGQQTVFLYNEIHNLIIIGLYKYVIASMPENKQEELVFHIADLHRRVIMEKNIQKRIEEEVGIKKDIEDLYRDVEVGSTMTDINILYEKVELYVDKYSAVQNSHKSAWTLMIITILGLIYSILIYMHYLNN